MSKPASLAKIEASHFGVEVRQMKRQAKAFSHDRLDSINGVSKYELSDFDTPWQPRIIIGTSDLTASNAPFNNRPTRCNHG